MGGFERKILIAFLILSVLPTFIIAFFGIRYFGSYMDRLSNVALRDSFRNSMEIARQYSMKLESDASAMALRLRDDYRVNGSSGALGQGRAAKEKRSAGAFLAGPVESREVHFAALYVLDGEVWRLESSYPSPIDRLDLELTFEAPAADARPRKIPFSDQDVVGYGVVEGRDKLLVSGFTLRPGMMDMMRQTGTDLSRYSSVGLYVNILRRYSLFVIGALVLIMAVAAAVASRLIARRISYPIQELAAATDRIAAGELDHRVTVKAKDEIQSLISSFNNMTQELEENKRNLVAMARREAQVARDLELARQVQQNLFPEALPVEEGWDFAATCRPARAVGGDYYDIFEVAPGKVLFAQGDVAGKGLGASLVMSGVHAVIRSSAGALLHKPEQLISELNAYLIASSADETFVTMFLGLLDCKKGKIWYINCGHPPAIVIEPGNGKPEDLTEGGPLLGIIPGENYETGECKLKSGDTLVLVSDGVTEATNPVGEMFDHGRFVATSTRYADLPARETLRAIIEEVDRFAAESEQADDISVMILKRTA
jgi:serine phosphatase RsbU (regulator of sigma subunit)